MKRPRTDPAGDAMLTADTVLSSDAHVEDPATNDPEDARAGAPIDECLTDDEILAFVAGNVTPRSLERIDAHLDRCSQCSELVPLATPAHELIDGSQRFGGLSLRPGSLVAGRYRIKRFVDRGGMGEVYEALDLKLDERVALKTVLCTAGDSRHAVRKLFAEVQLARRIAHRHVCRIYELHEHSEPDSDWPPVHFLTMEFIEGEKLGKHLEKGPLPLVEAAAITRQLLLGLQAAHDAGVLHLDFKSDNVMLRARSASPEAIVMDFGLARALDTQSRLRTSEQKQLAGSVAYMAPEQVECQPVLGEAADIYAFGVVLFEMLTGRLPFEGPSPAAVMLKRLKHPAPAPSSVRPEIGRTLDEFVLTCLSRDPRRRYADAGTALAAFELAVRDAVLPPRRRRRPLILAGVGLGSLACLGTFTLLRPAGEAESLGETSVSAHPLEPQPEEVPVNVPQPPPARDGPQPQTAGAKRGTELPAITSVEPEASSANEKPAMGAAGSSALGQGPRGAKVIASAKRIEKVALPASAPGLVGSQESAVGAALRPAPEERAAPRRAPGIPGAPPRLR